MNIIYSALFVMFVLLFSTAHAAPISDIDIVQGFPDDIIGGNIYNITLEHNSENIPVTYHFLFESPYPLDNSTLELSYVAIYCDGIILNNTRIHQNNTISVYGNVTLNQSRHEVIVYYSLAHNILPGNYSFRFEILTAKTQEPLVTYGGGSSSRRHSSSTKTCTFVVVPKFETPENQTIIPDVNITLPEETTSHDENITNTTKLVFQANFDNVNMTHVTEESDNFRYNVLVLLCAIIVVAGWSWVFRDEKKNRFI